MIQLAFAIGTLTTIATWVAIGIVGLSGIVWLVIGEDLDD